MLWTGNHVYLVLHLLKLKVLLLCLAASDGKNLKAVLEVQYQLKENESYF